MNLLFFFLCFFFGEFYSTTNIKVEENTLLVRTISILNNINNFDFSRLLEKNTIYN
jgi:hypothetical protein